MTWDKPPGFGGKEADEEQILKMKALMKGISGNALIAAKRAQAEAEAAAAAAEAAGEGRYIECYDPTHEAFYYYNSATQEVVWDKPANYVMAADDELMMACIKIQSAYRARKALQTELRAKEWRLRLPVDC